MNTVWEVWAYGGNESWEGSFPSLSEALEHAARRKDEDYIEDFIVMTVVGV